MRKYKLLLLPFFFVGNYYWAQNKDYVQGIVPQTPEVSSLFKNFETPVSLNTGIPNISIPLYTIKDGDIDFNLSLSYNSSGITVGERSTWVGLGWNLPISTLTRSVRQVPDDLSYGFFYETQHTVKNVYAIRNAQAPDQQLLCDEICQKHQQGILDLESDDYRLSLPDGKSISFMVNQERSAENPIGQIVQFPASDYKIKYNQTSGGWTVTSPSGYQYVYEKGNTIYFSHTYSIGGGSIGTPPSGGTDTYTNTWTLSKIISPANRTLNFEYDSVNYDDCDLINQTKTLALSSASQGGTDTRNEVFTNFGRTKGTNTFIKKIYGDFGEVIFNKSERQDYALYGRKLDNIEIKNNNRLINRIDLQYDYMTSAVPAPVYSCLRYEPNDNISKRLRLNKVLFSANTNKPYSYQLHYNNQPLPHRFSYARDWWGYYNGQNDNLGLTPSIDLVLEEQNKRNVDLESTKAGILEEIIYPTDGKTKFIFENNKGIDYMHSASIGNEFHNIVPYNIKSKLFSTNENTTQQLNKTFTVPIDINLTNLTNYQRLNLQIETQTTKCIYADSSLPDHGSCTIYYSIVNGNNEVLVPKLLLTNTSKTVQIGVNKFTANNNILKVEVYSGTQGGLGNQYFNYNQDYANVSVLWKELDNTLARHTDAGFEVPFGGLRIKKIENYSSSNALSLVREYSYKSDAGVESGISNFEMDFLQSGPNKIFVASQSRFPMQNNSSVMIEYLKTDETQTNILTNEKITTSHYFQNQNRLGDYLGSCLFINPNGEAFHTSASVPCYEHPMNNKEIRVASTVFTENKFQYNSNFPLYVPEHKKPQRVYGIDYDRTLKPQDFKYATYDLGYLFSQGYLGFMFFYYEFNNFEELPKEFTNTRTDIVNGTNLVTETQYSSLSPYHYQTTKETTTTDGVATETNYQYAQDKANQLMISKNMVGIPLETTGSQTMNGSTKTLSKSETVYPNTTAEITNNNASLVLPLSVKSYDIPNNTFSTEITYDKYDNKGNILQYRTKEGSPVAIVWGYNQAKPIAKVEGITYDQLVSSGLITAIVSASDEDAADPSKETLLITALDTFRRSPSLQNTKISTFTYDPLIGVTSITSSQGIREIYKYDSSNRLEKVSDEEGKPLKDIKYNYKN